MLRALGIFLLCVYLAIPAFMKAQVGEKPFTLPDWVSVEEDLSYGQAAEQKVDVYTPKRGAEGKRPGLLLIHGGGWKEGSRKSVIRVYAMPFLQEGFVVASVDYRMSGVAKAPAAVSDVLEALDWFKDQANRLNVDDDRIVVMGDSAGGHLALMAAFATKSAKLGPTNKVAAVVNIYGPSDLGELLSGPNRQAVVDEWLPEGPQRREVTRAVSPIIYVRKGLPPVKSVHGTADPLVPYAQTVRLTKELRAKGVNAELISVADGKHGFDDKTWNEDVYPQVFEFLKRVRVLR
ncbi:MAG: alpha/beta hydrolase [Bryobacterales bacterium]|nr:alpha/beta hydrolase [Bryobacterales bacterium]